MSQRGINLFTFFWKLENIRYSVQKLGEGIESPAFAVDGIDGTKWKLLFYPRGNRDGNNIGFYLRREADSKGADEVTINFSLSIQSKEGSGLAYHISHLSTFYKNLGGKYKDGYCWERSKFVTHNTLIAICKIWTSRGKIKEGFQCKVLTRIGIEKRYFEWNLKNFSTLRPEKKCSYQIKSTENKMPLMSVDLYLAGGSISEETVHFQLSLQDKTIKFTTFRLFLITSSGTRVKCKQEEMWFHDPDERKLFTFPFTKNTLLEEQATYLPNDTLLLFWELTFYKGVVSEEIEEDEHFCICTEVEVTDCQEMLGPDASNDNKNNLLNDYGQFCSLSHETSITHSFLKDLVENVKSLYDEHFLSDVKLKTSSCIFPAHKIILSASSSVFKAMFSNDMKEKISDCVYIEDLSDDTVSRMLFFMYTTRVEDLTWERATQLYLAADKYAILSLKNICSYFINKNLSPSNACEVLLLSNLHADGDLKSSAQNYILKNGKEITKLDEWKVLMQTNSMLAAETLCLLFK